MDKDEAIKELEVLFDKEIDKDLNEHDYLETWMHFLDYTLIAADEIRHFTDPLPKADVRKQLAKVSKALDAMGPQARFHLEEVLGFPDPNAPITTPSPVQVMIDATTKSARDYKQDRAHSFRNRHLVQVAQTIWIGTPSKYSGTVFARYVTVLAALAGIPHFNTDIIKRAFKEDPKPPRFNPHQL